MDIEQNFDLNPDRISFLSTFLIQILGIQKNCHDEINRLYPDYSKKSIYIERDRIYIKIDQKRLKKSKYIDFFD